MAAGQEFAANLSVLHQALSFQVLDRDGPLMVIQLANQILAIVNSGPAQKQVREKLHRPLALSNPATLVLRLPHLSQVRRIRRARLLLNLQEQRVVAAIAFQVDDVIAQPDAAGPYHPKSNIQRAVLVEKVLPLGQERFAIRAERLQDQLCRGGGKTVLQRLVFDKDPVPGPVLFRQLQQTLRVILRRRLLGFPQNLRNRRDTLQPMYLKVGYLHHRHVRETRASIADSS